MPLAGGSDRVLVSIHLVHVVLPGDFILLRLHRVDLLSELVDEPLQRILNEAFDRVALALARPVQFD